MMDKIEEKQFLEEQAEWCREQDRILAEIESNLYEMKWIAERVANSQLLSLEHANLTERFDELTYRVRLLELSLQTTVH